MVGGRRSHQARGSPRARHARMGSRWLLPRLIPLCNEEGLVVKGLLEIGKTGQTDSPRIVDPPETIRRHMSIMTWFQ
jgi:hypothetical protein